MKTAVDTYLWTGLTDVHYCFHNSLFLLEGARVSLYVYSEMISLHWVGDRDAITGVFCKSSGCNWYGFLYLDCHEFSLNILKAKNYKF